MKMAPQFYGRNFLLKTTGEKLDVAFGAAVDRAERQARETQNRANVHDGSLVSRLEAWQHGNGHGRDGTDVDRNHVGGIDRLDACDG